MSTTSVNTVSAASHHILPSKHANHREHTEHAVEGEKMEATTAAYSFTTSSESQANYCLHVNLSVLDSSAHLADIDGRTWACPIDIDDQDLTFRGKSLSAWYEERRRGCLDSANGRMTVMPVPRK
ncbi:hypothetical protein DCS_05105 [Drechmeria coniospora]|uniref:Uncharacterized protein n=1 Tax=Drechmeria coniospora TaxID=98403 RepID=A0A151GM72_DRECN|nr:hypothetical protein DCS_05105 [Drechmeria coniospora]KYK58092.1 hypothetical protein DCS_05105 [Drechmeria coniospora]ODA83070.1 hypothetical protein RJ55_01579 [Drechmeria coniospora]